MSDQISYARVKSDVESADSYSKRNQRKHEQEMQMIAQAMGLTKGLTKGVSSVLDAPCGVGRATIWMAQQGFQVTGIDLGEAALELARKLAVDAGVAARFESHDIFALPYADQAFDVTLCFRLLHHFESPELRTRLIREVCRVSGKYVLMSRISPLSVTSLRRRLRLLLTGKPIKQYPVSASQMHAEFAAAGFVPVGSTGRFALFHSLQLQVYRRK